MKLVVFWLLGVPVAVALMLTGFSFNAQTAAARSEVALVRLTAPVATACQAIVLTRDTRHRRPVPCSQPEG